MIMNERMWEILGIEETTDRKEIQQAYAMQLQKFHPEEHPEEFQRLQEAYRVACEYAKGVKSGQDTTDVSTREKGIVDKKTNSLFSDMNHPALKQQEGNEKEQIPNYIAELSNMEVKKIYMEDIEMYVVLLKEKLLGKKTEEDLRTLSDLFQDQRFCTLLGMKEFGERYHYYMDYYEEKMNKKAVGVMVENLTRMVEENKGKNLCLVELLESFTVPAELKSRQKAVNRRMTLIAIVLGAIGAIAVTCFVLLRLSVKMSWMQEIIDNL